jgi:hypothetical protein
MGDVNIYVYKPVLVLLSRLFLQIFIKRTKCHIFFRYLGALFTWLNFNKHLKHLDLCTLP